MSSVLRYSSEEIVWQEVPGETSLAYTITGCPVGCKGCHSVDTWPTGSGIELLPNYFEKRLSDYQGLITCVLFLGGEWHPSELCHLLRIAKAKGLKTCLYTGLENTSSQIKEHLDYLK
ncbi:MAG TPA: 4Fe-4S cluster-binding domain-containing protein, partial [Aliidiomarina sp.]|nr:4Fe-4S cluster-binding domain-containing protein [Aliidiomarina sp.]